MMMMMMMIIMTDHISRRCGVKASPSSLDHHQALSNDTVVQNKQLPWEQTDIGFTIEHGFELDEMC